WKCTRLSCGCWSLSPFNVLVISTFDSIALRSSLSDWSDHIAIPRAEVCALTHIAVASDLRPCVIYNDGEQRRGCGNLFGEARLRVNKSYATDRNSNRHNPVRWRSMDHG